MTQTEYKRIDLLSAEKVLPGRASQKSVEAIHGVTITRIQDGPLDFFLVKIPNVEDPYEVGVANFAGGIRKSAYVVKAKGGKASASADE